MSAGAEAKLRRMRSIVDSTANEIAKLREDAAELNGQIRARADAAVEEAWQETGEKLAAAEKRRAGLEREVALLSRLRDALEAARTTARDHYIRPVMAELKPLLGLLFEDASVTFDEDTLLPRTVRRNGLEEPVGVLSGGMSSRLFTEVREKRGLCYSVYATLSTLRDQGAVLCYAGTTNERAQETLDVLLAELARIADGIEPAELQRAQALAKSSLVMQQESSSSRARSLTRDWYHLGRATTVDEVQTAIERLTTEDVLSYLRAHPPTPCSIVTIGPQALVTPPIAVADQPA